MMGSLQESQLRMKTGMRDTEWSGMAMRAMPDLMRGFQGVEMKAFMRAEAILVEDMRGVMGMTRTRMLETTARFT
jgi:hypothetical protein